MKAQTFLAAVFITSALGAGGQPTGTISGVALHSVSSEPLAGVKVTFNYMEGSAITDSSGRFSFGAVKAGDYYFRAERDGLAKMDGRAVRLAEGERLTDLTLRLSPEAVISGRVLNAKGQPLEASVTVHTAGSRITSASERTKGGDFSLRGLAAGSYQISAQASFSTSNSYALTYYPGELARQSAGTITIAEGERKSGVVIVVRERPNFTIRGRFTGEVPEGRHTVVIYENRNGEPLGFTRTGMMDPQGRFTLELPSGEYRLKVQNSPQGPMRPVVLGFVEVNVVDAGVNDIIIPASAIRTVRAKLRWTTPRNQSPPDGVFLLNPTAGLGIMQYGTRGSDGWVTATRVSPDRYAVLPSEFPKGMYVQAILAGGVDISKTGLDLISGVSTDLEIIVADDGGLVTGLVVDSAKRPVAGARISVLRATSERPERELWSKHSLSDSTGRFLETDVAPGEYHVTAHANGKSSSAQTIRVTTGGRLALDLLIP